MKEYKSINNPVKKTLLFVALFVTLGVTSCKKDWTCSCNYDGTTLHFTEGYTNLSKRKAEAKCMGKVNAGITIVQNKNCKLN